MPSSLHRHILHRPLPHNQIDIPSRRRRARVFDDLPASYSGELLMSFSFDRQILIEQLKSDKLSEGVSSNKNLPLSTSFSISGFFKVVNMGRLAKLSINNF
jgi:hypothetical protein